jgi:hypothetical protein
VKIRVCEAAGQEYAGRVHHTGPGRGVMNRAEYHAACQLPIKLPLPPLR